MSKNIYLKAASIAVISVGGIHGFLWLSAYLVYINGGDKSDYYRVVSAVLLMIAVFFGAASYLKHKQGLLK